ncbi:MAG: tyrosine-type recombinase/integrase [Thermoguttaceae bacterium]|jgi:integrase
MLKPTRKPDSSKKPAKPRPDFPLFPHATGRWAKKVRGKFHYFGKVSDDPRGETALQAWLDQRDDLLAGRTPRVKAEGLTIHDLVNRFLASKRHLVDTREITHRTFSELFAMCERVGDSFGWDRLVVDLAADDFEPLRRQIAKKWGPIRLGNEIQRVRSLFKFGFEAGLIEQPVRYGPAFKKPTRKVLRMERAKKGPRMLEAADLRRIMDKAGMPLKAMILLGLNCGFGNADVAGLPITALDLKTGWVDYPRPKTGVPRRCPLWPETAAALQEALARRPKPNDKAYDALVFLTKFRRPWRCCELKVSKESEEMADDEISGESGKSAAPGEHQQPKLRQDDAVAKEFIKVLKALGLHRAGLGFYCLRHTFETIGGDGSDQVAVDSIMGHVREDMASMYRERVNDDRLRRVTDHVRTWLFPPAQNENADDAQQSQKAAQ